MKECARKPHIISKIIVATLLFATPALAQATHSVRFIAGGATFGGGNGPIPYDGTGAAAALTGGIGQMALGADGQIYFPGLRFHTIRRMNSMGNVSSFAGIRGQEGNIDGPVSSATFTYPPNMISDGAGGFYVISRSDNGNLIRKISINGMVSTLNINFPQGKEFFGQIAMAPAGKLYISYSNSIMILDPSSGALANFVGDLSDNSGYADGNGASAKFFGIGAMITDSLGNIYLTDVGNRRIRKISSNGQVTTIAGSGQIGRLDGAPNIARFNHLQAIARDNAGNLYVGDVRSVALNSGCWIRKIAPNGAVSSLAGANSCGYANGNAIGAARFNSFTTMLYAHNRLYVFDSETSRIRYICRKSGPSAGSAFGLCPP